MKKGPRNPLAVALGRKASNKLTPEERRAKASHAARTRWARHADLRPARPCHVCGGPIRITVLEVAGRFRPERVAIDHCATEPAHELAGVYLTAVELRRLRLSEKEWRVNDPRPRVWELPRVAEAKDSLSPDGLSAGQHDP